MMKKMLATTLIFAGAMSNAWASFYVAPSLSYESIGTRSNIRYQDISPRLALAYEGYIRDWLYLAGEIFGGPQTIDVNNEPKQGFSLKVKYSYGFGILPGYYFDEVLMGFLRLGYIWSDFDKLNVTKGGYQIGLGLQARIADCWDARGEFDYTRYNRLSSTGQPHSETYTVAAVYHFDI